MKAGGYTMQCDVVIVGAGPAGIFTALELIRGNTKENKNINIMQLVLLQKKRHLRLFLSN